jgi:hypothetical protein
LSLPALSIVEGSKESASKKFVLFQQIFLIMGCSLIIITALY